MSLIHDTPALKLHDELENLRNSVPVKVPFKRMKIDRYDIRAANSLNSAGSMPTVGCQIYCFGPDQDGTEISAMARFVPDTVDIRAPNFDGKTINIYMRFGLLAAVIEQIKQPICNVVLQPNNGASIAYFENPDYIQK